MSQADKLTPPTLQKLALDRWPVNVGFLATEVDLGQSFLQALQFPLSLSFQQ
jgi:hypothetical protein